MNKNEFDRAGDIKVILKAINMVCLTTHIIFIYVFYTWKIYAMVYVNIGSVILYALLSILLVKDLESIYIVMVYIEVWIHMMCATICVGWECGFQVHYFSILIPAVFTRYFMKKMRSSLYIILALMSIIIYTILRWYTFKNPPIYNYGSEFERLKIYIINSLVGFGVTVACLLLYAKVVESLQKELRNKADYDNLTGIYNRNRIEYLLLHLIKEIVMTEDSFYLAILDIDDFKKVNDDYGHNAGDCVLRVMADIIKKDLSAKEDIAYVGRWGGEEFLIISKKRCEFAKFMSMLDKFHQDIRNKKIMYEKESMSITVTIGVAKYDIGMSLEEVVEKADKRLYIGKKTGKNKIISDYIV